MSAPNEPTDISREVAFALLEERLHRATKAVEEFGELLEEKYVTKSEFVLVRSIVFGAVALALVTVGAAILALVVTK